MQQNKPVDRRISTGLTVADFLRGPSHNNEPKFATRESASRESFGKTFDLRRKSPSDKLVTSTTDQGKEESD